MNKLFGFLFLLVSFSLSAQNTNQSKFKQLYEELPTPNMYRTGGGAPGSFYYQQKADYKMEITLDDATQKIYGEEVISYTNNSPDALEYLWIQLDQNKRAIESPSQVIKHGKMSNKMSYYSLKDLYYNFDGGFKIDYVRGADDEDLDFFVNNTMLRINLEKPLMSGETFEIKMKWWYNINDRMQIGGRSGYEYFKDEDNYLYTIAQFFPRMAVYSDVEGWQNKQFLGTGEFTLPFGDYDVILNVPEDHIVGSTGELQNPEEVLTKKQLERLEQARNNTEDPVMIVNQQEAEKAEKKHKKELKAWHFKAENVRDFAFASSRKFIWDAMAVKFGDRTVMAMSYYPKEGNPLWEQYSTRVVAHTLKVYSKYTFNYPYSKAISVHTDRIGMEYPMICFNGGRPEADGTYSQNTKYGMIGVIIHEVGHNFFPMIVNSDERQWTWMDEGLNTFVQYLTEQEWDVDYPSRRGPAYKITDYMMSSPEDLMPIMTNSESILQFGNNAYGKPATALNILRETVMGRELFDYSFKKYSERWMFKHPTPADFFRTMEDASGTDLDWFFRGWFYTTDYVDISLESVKHFTFQENSLDAKNARLRKEAEDQKAKFIGYKRNKAEFSGKTIVDSKPAETKDFYNENDAYEVYASDKITFDKKYENLSEEEKAIVDMNSNYYELSFLNKGGLVMPVILSFTFADGSTQVIRIPAEVWLRSEERFSKVFTFDKEVVNVELDPYLETADTDRSNNYWPERNIPSRFELYKSNNFKGQNQMQKAK